MTDVLTKNKYKFNPSQEILATHICKLCNNLWEQTLRFEDYMEDYKVENIRLEDDVYTLKEQNRKLRELLFDPRRVTNEVKE